MGIFDRLKSRTAAPQPQPWGPSAAAAPPPAPALMAARERRVEISLQSGTWLQWPRFRPGDVVEQVVGESYYQDAIARVAGGKTPDGAAYPVVTAQLVPDPDNPYDANAVRVMIHGEHVGYVARDRTSIPLELFYADPTRPLTFRAHITGGWDRPAEGFEPRSVGDYGVELLMTGAIDETEPASDPFICSLPHQNWVSATKPDLEWAADALGDQLSYQCTVELDPSSERVAVVCGGQPRATLTRAMSERYRPLLDLVAAAGVPLTASAVLQPRDSKLRLVVVLPGARIVDRLVTMGTALAG